MRKKEGKPPKPVFQFKKGADGRKNPIRGKILFGTSRVSERWVTEAKNPAVQKEKKEGKKHRHLGAMKKKTVRGRRKGEGKS